MEADGAEGEGERMDRVGTMGQQGGRRGRKEGQCSKDSMAEGKCSSVGSREGEEAGTEGRAGGGRLALEGAGRMLGKESTRWRFEGVGEEETWGRIVACVQARVRFCALPMAALPIGPRENDSWPQ